ncbi:hypothetical protein [Thermococcus barophilus]|uniref:KaiC-like domain-containing protein n=1 Tax=Thermococcus barophilus TaxID=55802 RepID=A0A0S1XCC9_THEBA|nr:hypothetical protein [Thermococcus barophilus]ALM75415.1 hypothetical protein TBCH5v1_1499 [Thermococcus barophilus]
MIIKTLYEELDNVMGGGITEGATMTILYDTYSFAQYFALHILARRLKAGDFGVISNYSHPIGRVIRGAKFAGLDIMEEGKKGNLIIIDYFSSKYELSSKFPFAHTLSGQLGEDTINPKTFQIYRDYIIPKLNGRTLIRVIYTLDGLAFFFGEDTTLKLLYYDLAKFVDMIPKSITLLLLNVDTVSKKFIARVVDVSDYVIEFKSRMEQKGIVEDVVLVKALVPEFSPEIFEFLIGKKKEEAGDKFSFKKVTR